MIRPTSILFKISMVILIFAVLSISLFACTSTTSTKPSITQTSSQTSTTTTSSVATKTVKIGFMADLSSSTAIDSKKGLELAAEIDNKAGGVQIGGDNYNVQIISYDGKNDQATEAAAINRLIFQDKVSFIIAASGYDAFVPTVDSNKVLTFVNGLNPTDFSTQYHYIFNANLQTAAWAAYIGYYCKTYPDKVKTVVRAFQENQGGHFVSSLTLNMWKANGVTPIDEFYPADLADLSSVATKIVSYNPTLVTTQTGSDTGDALVFNGIYQAGYRGVLFSTSTATVNTLKETLSPGALEGFVAGSWPYEYNPSLTPLATSFKNAWIAKNGNWQDPNVVIISDYYALKAALQKAGTVDTTAAADALSSGMIFDSPTGSARMMSRPDLGQSRTVDSVATYYLKTVKDGKATLLATIPLDQALAYYQAANPSGSAPFRAFRRRSSRC